MVEHVIDEEKEVLEIKCVG